MSIERDPEGFFIGGGLVTQALRDCGSLDAAEKIAEGITPGQLEAVWAGDLVVAGDNRVGYWFGQPAWIKVVYKVAQAFHAEVRDGEDQLVLDNLDAANREPGFTGCATHDLCDANMVMESAFTTAMGRDPDVGDADDTALWNRAWSVARAHGFAREWLTSRVHREIEVEGVRTRGTRS